MKVYQLNCQIQPLPTFTIQKHRGMTQQRAGLPKKGLVEKPEIQAEVQVPIVPVTESESSLRLCLR